MQYQDGTVSVTNGSSTITGSGTLWLANINAGDLFTKLGDNVMYTVASIPSNTSLTLTAPYGGSASSGSAYGITINFTAGGLPLLSAGDLNTAAINSEQMKGIDNYNLSNLGAAAYADKVGLVSNGAIIESDSNANGSYTKWIDGTMMCVKSVTFSDQVSTPYGSVFISTSSSGGSWASNFNTIQYSNVSASRSGNAPIDFQIGSGVASSTNAPSGWFVSAVSVNTTISLTMEIIGIGRWL